MVKKIIAFAVVIFITFRLIVISVSASFAAPVFAAEEITTLLETALIGSGLYTESELEGKSYLELNDLLKDEINSGRINPRTKYYTDPISGVQFSLIDLFSKPEAQVAIGLSQAQAKKVGEALYDSTIGYWFSTDVLGEDIYDKFHPTYTEPVIDLQGSGAVLKLYYRNQGSADAEIDRYRIVYCEYVEVQDVGDGTYNFYCRNPAREVTYNLKGELQDIYDLNGQSSAVYSQSKVGDNFSISGDCRRLEDGSIIDTSGEAIPVIGEAGGTQVTPDMLNPDGTVTIDGTTYYPKDFIDLDKFKDPSIIDLLNQILAKIDTIPVSEPDTTKDLVDSITESVSVSVPDELSDYIMPSGIISVFPFCLPVDLYRGFKLLNVAPVAPVLKIPFEIPEFGYFKGYKTVLTIEFEKYDKYFSVFRWGTYFLFVISLIFISTKIVKGAGA